MILVTQWTHTHTHTHTHRLEEERVEGDEEGSAPAAHLEHLPAFTERWVAEALTPSVLSQVQAVSRFCLRWRAWCCVSVVDVYLRDDEKAVFVAVWKEHEVWRLSFIDFVS